MVKAYAHIDVVNCDSVRHDDRNVDSSRSVVRDYRANSPSRREGSRERAYLEGKGACAVVSCAILKLQCCRYRSTATCRYGKGEWSRYRWLTRDYSAIVLWP